MKIGVLVPVLVALSAPAYAGEVWHFNNYKRCTAMTEFKASPTVSPEVDEDNNWPRVLLYRKDPTLGPRGGPEPSVLEEPDTAVVYFKRKHIAKLEAAVRFLKKCRVWVWDRNRGKAIYLTPKEMKELDEEAAGTTKNTTPAGAK
jgi:hypothetical protein